MFNIFKKKDKEKDQKPDQKKDQKKGDLKLDNVKEVKQEVDNQKSSDGKRSSIKIESLKQFQNIENLDDSPEKLQKIISDRLNGEQSGGQSRNSVESQKIMPPQQNQRQSSNHKSQSKMPSNKRENSQQSEESVESIQQFQSGKQNQNQNQNQNQQQQSRFNKQQQSSQAEFEDEPDELNSGRMNKRLSKLSLQNKVILKNQQLYLQEIEEKNNEQKRDEILALIKQQLAFKQLNAFELFTTYDDPTTDFQIRIFEFEQALNSIEVVLDRKSINIMMKYFRVPDLEQVATFRLCWFLMDDAGELVILAINYIINKYRLLFEVLFDEITGPDKIINIDVLENLNEEFNWNLDEDKVQKAYNILTDYGNQFLDFFKFKKKLDEATQAWEFKYNQTNYQQFQMDIIEAGKGKLDQITTYLTEQDTTQTGEIGLFNFFDLISMYFNRAVSKQEIMVSNTYLIKKNEDNIINYSKLLTDCQKTMEDQEQQMHSLHESLLLKQNELINQYFNSIIDTKTELHLQYFKGEKQFSMDKDSFITATIKLTGFQVDEENAHKLYAVIVQNKPKNQENVLNVHEFKQFLDQYVKDKPNEQNKETIRSIKTDIYILFDQLDTKRIRSLTQNQMFYGIQKLGFLISSTELLKYKSFDYALFEKTLLKILANNCYNVKKTIFNIKREFEFVKDHEDDQISMFTLKQVFDNLVMNLKFEDIIYFYQILDVERTGFIKLSDFLYVLYQHTQIDFKLSELIFKIKGYKDYPISMMKSQFELLPDNFVRPFTEKAHLTSCAFKFLPDYVGSVLNGVLKKNSTNRLYKFKIKSVTGIPSPKDPSIIFRRECVIAIYDKFYKKFVQNSITLKAVWKPNAPEIWQLQSDFNPIHKFMGTYTRNIGFLLNCDKLKYFKEYYLIFEFIAYIKHKDCNQSLKVSCGYAELSFEHILFEPPPNIILEKAFSMYAYQEKTLQIYGGTPEQILSINPEDIRMKKKQNVQPSMMISIQKRSRRKDLLKEVEYLPDFCLIERTMTQIVYAFRKSGKEKLEESFDPSRNPKFNFFLFCLDNPYVCNKMCKFWNTYVKGRLIGQEVKAFDILIGQLIKLAKMKDFSFNPYSPNEIYLPEQCVEKKKAISSVLLYCQFLFDLNFLLQLGLDGNVILDEQINLYGQSLQWNLFNASTDMCDPFYNGLNLDAYQDFTQL